MRITELFATEDKCRHLSLLLEADPSEEMIMQYLPESRMFLLEQVDLLLEKTEQVMGSIVLADLGNGRCEIKNLAIARKIRGKGYGRLLVEHAASIYAENYVEMLVGTGEAEIPFFERCGFSHAYISPNFFVINYPDPVWNNGQRCKDLHYLSRNLRRGMAINRHTTVYNQSESV